MSREFQLKEIEGNKYLAFPIQSVREVDDIIIQLLNDADQDGFLKSKVIKAQKEIVFDIGNLTSLHDFKESVPSRDHFIHVLEDLKDMLVYLEDSFIGPEYISFDEKSVFIDPGTGKLYLTVLPLQNPGHDDTSMQGFVKNLISKYAPEKADSFYDLAASRASAGITKISDLDNLISRLKEEASKEPPAEEIIAPAEETTAEETPAEIPAENAAPEEIPAEVIVAAEIPAEETAVEEIAAEEIAPEEILADDITVEEIAAVETAVEEIAAEEKADTEIPAEEKADMEIPAEEAAAIEETPDRTIFFDKQTGNELNAALAAVEAVLPTAFEAELRAAEQPVEINVPEIEEAMERESAVPAAEIPSEPEAEIPEEAVPAEPEAESPEEVVPAEPEEEIPEEVVPAEPEPEAPAAESPAEPELTAYLFRKKSSELVPLTSDPFVIGKIPIACDYVITDNPALSRIHAMIRYAEEEEAYFIIDCNSTNHVYVNGLRVTGQQIARLADKDRIHLATEEFVFHLQK